MKFGVLCFLVAAVENVRAVLSPASENVCLFYEKYIDVVLVSELVQVKVYKVEWCWSIPPRCTVEREELKPTTVKKEVPRVRVVPKCCNGYEEIVEENRCVPHCPKPCVNGNCVEPDTCSCESGFYGHSCEKTCLSGTWGRGCLEKCDCQNNATCNGISGSCSCTPGWRGFRCDLPCDLGHYGTNCENRCNCDTGLCNHVSGECEVISQTTPITTETATDETIFQTSTTDETTFHTNNTEATVYETFSTEETIFETTASDVTDMVTEITTITTDLSLSTVTGTTMGIINVTIYNREFTEETVWETENSTILVEDVSTSRPDLVWVYFTENSNYPNHADNRNETDEDNEIERSNDFSSSAEKKTFNLIYILENFSIICGIFVLIFILTMGSVIISHYRKMKKMVFECQSGDTNSQDFPMHRFYGGSMVLPGKPILDNQINMANMDLEVEQPKLLTFKPLPDDKSKKEYFMAKNDITQDYQNGVSEQPHIFRVVNDDYINQVDQFNYDVPKSTTFAPNRFKYG